MSFSSLKQRKNIIAFIRLKDGAICFYYEFNIFYMSPLYVIA